MEDPCAACAPLQDGVEIENELGTENVESLPKAFDDLESLADLESLREHSLKRCPSCLRDFRYRRWTPGGSDDAMRTYLHERVAPLSLVDVHEALEEAGSNEAIQRERVRLRERADELVGDGAALLHGSAARNRNAEQNKNATRQALVVAAYLPYCARPREALACANGLLVDPSNAVRAVIARALGRDFEAPAIPAPPRKRPNAPRYHLTNPTGPTVPPSDEGRCCPRCGLASLRAEGHYENHVSCPLCGYDEWVIEPDPDDDYGSYP